MKYCIVIPCYNEESRFPQEEFIQHLNSNSENAYCLVNDGSKDKTSDMLNNLKKLAPERIQVLNLEKNVGKGEAVRQGMNFALAWSEFEFLAVFDADFATPLEEFEYMLSYVKSFNKFIVAARWKHLGANIQRDERRHYLGRVFATVVSISLKLPVYDTQCGAKILTSDAAKSVFKESFISRWLFDVEIFHRLRLSYPDEDIHKLVLEVPLRTWIEKGESRLKVSDFLKAPLLLYRIHRRYRKTNQYEKK